MNLEDPSGSHTGPPITKEESPMIRATTAHDQTSDPEAGI